MTSDTQIGEKVERVETIIETLEDGDVSLERATELRDEGESLLADLRTELEIGDGEVTRQE